MTGTAHHRSAGTAEPSVGELVKQASEQISELVRQEMRLAQAELTQKGKRAGIGGGLFGGAGLTAFIAFQALAVAAVAAVAMVLPVWAAGLVVAGALLIMAGVLALTGKKQIGQAVPPTPKRAIDSVKADVQVIKERAHR